LRTLVPAIVPSEQIAGTPGATLTVRCRPSRIMARTAPGANRPVIRGFDNLGPGPGERHRLHDVSAWSETTRADRPRHHRPPRWCAARNPRYGSQAIGGVVNAITSRIPRSSAQRHQSETRGGFSSVDRGTDGMFK
jgi:hypothetical protein